MEAGLILTSRSFELFHSCTQKSLLRLVTSQAFCVLSKNLVGLQLMPFIPNASFLVQRVSSWSDGISTRQILIECSQVYDGSIHGQSNFCRSIEVFLCQLKYFQRLFCAQSSYFNGVVIFQTYFLWLFSAERATQERCKNQLTNSRPTVANDFKTGHLISDRDFPSTLERRRVICMTVLVKKSAVVAVRAVVKFAQIIVRTRVSAWLFLRRPQTVLHQLQ